MDRFSSYCFGEGKTGLGQKVEFEYPDGVDVEQVRKFLLENIRTIDTPTTGRVNVSHGGYGRYTRYDVKQHDYAGGGSGYIEVLEIKNPPDDRWGIVIFEYPGYGNSVFTEWETLKDARGAFSNYWGSCKTAEEFPKCSGFKRRVLCGALTPWFYAIGDELLIGDYAFPDGLQDDLVYRFGKRFIVTDRDGVPSIRTCMGTRFREEKDDFYPYKESRFRLVYWDDGTVWRENFDSPPRPLEEGELWIVEAVQQFVRLLAGKNTEFAINLTNGNKFVGRLKKSNGHSVCAEGDYLAVVNVKGKKEPRQGWIRDFKPTPETPNIVQYIHHGFAREGHKVERVEIKESKIKKGGKKWAGVFFGAND